MHVLHSRWRRGWAQAAAVLLAVVAAPLAAVSAATPAAGASCPWADSTAPIATRVSELMAQMSLTQKVDMMTGAGGSYVGNIPAISSLCVPAMNLEDGPAGVGDGMSNVTQLPAPVDVAATWDTSAEQEYGQVIGAEQAAKGTTVDLGPTINIVRDPRWGGGATHSTVASANAGLDMDMPGNDGFYGTALVNAVNSGSVAVATINSAVSGILTEMFAFGLFDKAPGGSTSAVATSSAHQADAAQLAEEGTVLLKNSGSVLPLSSSDTSIAVIGADASTSPQTDGGGSAGVNSSGTITPLQGIQAAAPSGTTVTYNNGSSDSSAASAAAAASVAIVFANLGESEGSDLSSIDLGTSQDNLITSVAAANPNTIVVLNAGSAVTMPWLSPVKGVLDAWYPGQEDGTAIASVLFGGTDPSGHLPVTFPASLSQVPASTTAQWPGTGGTVQYSEGVDVGYRWYDSKGVTPLFPFGYGLSYTTFSFSNLNVGPLTAGGAATVTATVTNTGTRSGADVAQLYVTDPSASGQPPLQLEGFQRVNLAAGASTTVTFTLTQQNLRYWNSTSNAWATSTGNYSISVGDSSASLPLTGTLSVASSQLGQPVTLANPGPQADLTGQAATSVTLSASDTTTGQTLTYSAADLPAGLSISSAGVISGTPTTAGTSTVTVTAKDGNGAYATQSFVWTISPGGTASPPPPPGSLQISAGGPATGTWAADEDFSGGSTASTTNAISSTGVTNPAPQSVYQHNRYGNFTYAVPGYTPGAAYTIRLHFAEEYWSTAGSRVFNVLIDGTQVLTNFDILATAGGEYKAVVEQFTTTVPSSGVITIQFATVKDNAQINGIEILSG